MANHGHNITIISADIEQNPPPGVHYILIENQYTAESREFVKEMMRSNEELDATEQIWEMIAISIDFCKGKIIFELKKLFKKKANTTGFD